MEEETGVMRPQAKECLPPPEAGGGKERTVPGASRGKMTLLTSWPWPVKLILEFQPPELVREYVSVV